MSKPDDQLQLALPPVCKCMPHGACVAEKSTGWGCLLQGLRETFSMSRVARCSLCLHELEIVQGQSMWGATAQGQARDTLTLVST